MKDVSDARIPKQLLSSMTDKAARQALLDNHIIPSVEGNADINKKIENNTIAKEVEDLDVDDKRIKHIQNIVSKRQNLCLWWSIIL